MSSWRDRAACGDLPYDWWTTGDPGNRLALLICQLRCPVRTECAQPDDGDEYLPGISDGARRRPRHAGVIRGGVAHHPDTGMPLPVCACGYPFSRTGGATECRSCDPPHTAVRWFSRRAQTRAKEQARRARKEALAS